MLLQALFNILQPLVNSNWSYSPEAPNLGQIRRFLEPCDLEIWRMKNNRAPFLSIIKLYATFHHHMWIQTGVTVRKRLSWVVTPMTLTFDLWPWPFARTLPWTLVITPENFMIIRLWEHCLSVCPWQADRRTDRQTDRRTEKTIHRAAWSQLKIAKRRKLQNSSTCLMYISNAVAIGLAVLILSWGQGKLRSASVASGPWPKVTETGAKIVSTPIGQPCVVWRN